MFLPCYYVLSVTEGSIFGFKIGRLPGVEYSKEEQQQKLETLRKQLQLKKDLLRKYRNMCTFEIPKS